MSTRLLLTGALAWCLGGCASVQPGSTALSPQQCSGLSAAQVPASAIGLPTNGAIVRAASTAPPGHCAVEGEILPVDPKAPTIRFQVNLPPRWNGKALQMGGGGSNGVIPRAVVTAQGSPLGATIAPDLPTPLARGYVTLGSDSGHRLDDQAWLGNEEAVTNFAYAQMKKTHDVATELIRRAYGRPPHRFYYFGFSQGGREALEVAQRFPADYDGIFSQAPVLYFGVALTAALRDNLQLSPGSWLPPAKAPVIAREVLRQCDAIDGLRDGVIDNYVACERLFDPAITPMPYATVRCPSGMDEGPNCLSDAQITTANRLRGGVDFGFALANGISRIPGFGTGLEDTRWDLLSQQQPVTGRPQAGSRAAAIVRITIAGDANFDLQQFSMPDHREAIQRLAAKVDTSNADLSAFRARGGKLIFKSHASDYLANPRALADYYARVVEKLGQDSVDQFVRFYMTPNADHGGAGKSADGRNLPQYIDAYTLLEDWVERGIPPPDAPVLTSQPDANGRITSKPICRYPKYPRYAGQGDPGLAGSYACVGPTNDNP